VYNLYVRYIRRVLYEYYTCRDVDQKVQLGYWSSSMKDEVTGGTKRRVGRFAVVRPRFHSESVDNAVRIYRKVILVVNIGYNTSNNETYSYDLRVPTATYVCIILTIIRQRVHRRVQYPVGIRYPYAIITRPIRGSPIICTRVYQNIMYLCRYLLAVY